MSDRGTSNSNSRGNSKGRRMRREWIIRNWGESAWGTVPCFYCGTTLMDGTLTIDRIIPGHVGGAYQYGNIRPACLHCNSIEGSKMRDLLKRGVDFFSPRYVTLTGDFRPHVLPWSGRLAPGQQASVLHLLGDGRMSKSRIAREVGCHVSTVDRIAA